MTKEEIIKRFWQKVNKSDGCWEFTGTPSQRYPVVSLGNLKYIKAHRYSYQVHCGEIPEGMMVCHKCDNPKCVRPEHLFLGTCKENLQDMSRKKRGFFNRPQSGIPRRRGESHPYYNGNPLLEGEKSPNARLTNKTVKEIRQSYEAGGISQDALAIKYGVSQSGISAVIRKQTWDHVD